MDITKKTLPNTITVAGNVYKLKTDFRYWIMFSKIIQKSNYELEDFNFLYEDIVPYNKDKALLELFKFAFPTKILPKVTGNADDVQLYDFEIDADMIYSAFYAYYKIDLIDTDMHWYKFKALFDNLKGTSLNDIMQYRAYRKSSKTQEQFMQEQKRAWTIPIDIESNLTEEEKQKLEFFEKLNKGQNNG